MGGIASLVSGVLIIVFRHPLSRFELLWFWPGGTRSVPEPVVRPRVLVVFGTLLCVWGLVLIAGGQLT
jgi:hypothetical protein